MNNTYMPAEWQPHEATWLAWPYGDQSFAGRIPAAEAAFMFMIKALAGGERVKLIVRSEQKKEVEQKLKGIQNVDFFETEYIDVWARDWGPTFLTNGVYVKWNYDGYGGKFPGIIADGLVPDRVLAGGTYKRVEAGIAMEGGAIETNGAGAIIATEETLIRGNRNPGMSKSEYEKKFKELLGAERVVWLPHGLMNDHTDGHVDEVARFVSADTVLYAWEEKGENHERMSANLEVLKRAGFKLIPLTLPQMFYDNTESPNYDAGARAPASYCNFYVGNNVVLVPTFNDPADADAQKILKQAFPDHEIVPIPATDLIYGGGGVHCVTQQEPRVVN